MADTQNLYTSPLIGRHVKIKKGGGKNISAAGNVTENNKNGIIDLAAIVWKDMGLTKEQVATGIATMNVESGFNPMAKSPTSSHFGLGQMSNGTWGDAVDVYNKYFHETLDPAIERKDLLSQVKVMGAWMKEKI